MNLPTGRTLNVARGAHGDVSRSPIDVGLHAASGDNPSGSKTQCEAKELKVQSHPFVRAREMGAHLAKRVRLNNLQAVRKARMTCYDCGQHGREAGYLGYPAETRRARRCKLHNSFRRPGVLRSR